MSLHAFGNCQHTTKLEPIHKKSAIYSYPLPALSKSAEMITWTLWTGRHGIILRDIHGFIDYHIIIIIIPNRQTEICPMKSSIQALPDQGLQHAHRYDLLNHTETS
jgi:hypothetical protein